MLTFQHYPKKYSSTNANKFKLLSISTIRTHPQIHRLEIWLASFDLTSVRITKNIT